MTKRIQYIDIAKGIAILLVVLGHLGLIYPHSIYAQGIPQTLTTFIFTFHMPLFFLVSGYFFKAPEGLTSQFIKKDAKSLLIPYYVTALIVMVFAVALACLNGLGVSEVLAVAKKWIIAALYGMGAPISSAPEGVTHIGAIWFLWGLFWARCFLALVINQKYAFVYLLLLFGLGTLSANYFWFPLSIQSGMTAALFLWVGLECRKREVFSASKPPIPLVVFGLIMWLAATLANGGVTPVTAYYPYGVLSVVVGVIASCFTVKFSQLIEAKSAHITQFLTWIGRNTLPIFCMHLVEDNLVAPMLLDLLLAHAPFLENWVLVFILRMLLIGLMCAVLWFIPPLKRVYFPHALKKRKTA